MQSMFLVCKGGHMKSKSGVCDWWLGSSAQHFSTLGWGAKHHGLRGTWDIVQLRTAGRNINTFGNDYWILDACLQSEKMNRQQNFCLEFLELPFFSTLEYQSVGIWTQGAESEKDYWLSVSAGKISQFSQVLKISGKIWGEEDFSLEEEDQVRGCLNKTGHPWV